MVRCGLLKQHARIPTVRQMGRGNETEAILARAQHIVASS